MCFNLKNKQNPKWLPNNRIYRSLLRSIVDWKFQLRAYIAVIENGKSNYNKSYCVYASSNREIFRENKNQVKRQTKFHNYIIINIITIALQIKFFPVVGQILYDKNFNMIV